MAYFEWADDLVIDNGPIDADHLQLVDIVNQLHTATTLGQGQEIVADLMEKLVGYTLGHLQREEQLMASVNFPRLAHHKIAHDKFIEQLNELKKKYDAGSFTVASQLSTLLRDWLSLHIRRYDKELKVYLKRAPSKKPS